LRDQRPDQLKLPFYLWTREAVVQLIEQGCGVSVSVWTAGRYLKAWGFTPQKPMRRACERNPRAVACWLKREYPTIRAHAKQAKAEIYWADEMGVRSDQPVGRSFSPRGETPVIPGTGQRFGCNQLSALTNRGHLLFMVFQCGFTTRVFLDFLRRLERQARRPVFLIVDGHPVHKARAIKTWLARPGCRVRLFFLPGYSPELNPDELLNHDVKDYVGRHRPRTRAELVHTVRGHLRRRQRQPHIVRRYFQGKHVQYAAA
jgi:transposase